MKDHNIVSVSGGKDSTATLLLALERDTDNLSAVFADTGHEHAQTYEYLNYLEGATGVKIKRIKPDFSHRIAHKREVVQTKWRKDGVPESVIDEAMLALAPTGNPFLDMCLWKGRFPSTKARFCTEELKRNPIIEQIYKPLLADPETNEVTSWQGVRADESQARAKLPMSDESDGVTNYRPILYWNIEQVFAFHRKHGIKWNPLYEQGAGRVGCMPCIMVRKDELKHIAQRFPEEIERVASWEAIVAKASKRGNATFFCAITDPTVSSDADLSNAHVTHGIHRVIEWSKTTRGGRQFDLIASSGPDVGCSSAYGLCETGVVSDELMPAVAI